MLTSSPTIMCAQEFSMIYFVTLAGPYSPKEPVDWTQECPVSELTRERVQRNITEGQWDDVTQIIEVDLESKTSSDVTAEIAQEIASTYDSEDPLPEALADFFLRNNVQTW